MPTIDLSRLKVEAAQLSDHFSEPATYLRGLQHLLQSYAMRPNRLGRIAGMRPVLASYEVPPPMLKHLHFELGEQAKQNPRAALEVADGLWAKRTMETRLLAAHLLGAINAEPAQITARLEAWAQENREASLAPELAEGGTTTLCAMAPEALVAFSQRLLASGEPRKQSLALEALHSLLSNTSFANLPLLFDMLAPLCQTPGRRLRPDLANLLLELAQRSPQETEFFLQQCLEAESNAGIEWIARQVLKALPADGQARLRVFLKT
jgi:hypothetical protein